MPIMRLSNGLRQPCRILSAVDYSSSQNEPQSHTTPYEDPTGPEQNQDQLIPAAEDSREELKGKLLSERFERLPAPTEAPQSRRARLLAHEDRGVEALDEQKPAQRTELAQEDA